MAKQSLKNCLYNPGQSSRYESLLDIPSGIWFFCPPTHHFAKDLFKLGEQKLVCPFREQAIFFMVFPVLSIENRVRIGNTIEEKIVKKYGNPLSAEWICGPSNFWHLFVGFYKYCIEFGLVDSHAVGLDNLVLNLFAATFENTVCGIGSNNVNQKEKGIVDVDKSTAIANRV